MTVSLALLYFDYSYRHLSSVRQWLTVATVPVFFLADLPGEAWGAVSEVLVSRSELLQEISHLKAKNLILEHKVQKLESLTAQNISLRGLLNSAGLFDEQVLVAEVVGIDPDPFSHRVVVNKGAFDNVYEGQAILDANGVMGQVVEVGHVSSRILILTDIASRVPVQNNRTKYRAIAAGTGLSDRMELLHIPETEDFKKGDILTSSGLGGVYPEGYPVGVVTNVTHHPGQAFAEIKLRPMAWVNRSRVVLLVFRGDKHVKTMKGSGDE